MQGYIFNSGDVVPGWLFQVKDIPSGVVAESKFGVPGIVVLVNGAACVCPFDGREPEAFVFNTAGFWGNASSGHPSGDALLKVFYDFASAQIELGQLNIAQTVALPASDPRQ